MSGIYGDMLAFFSEQFRQFDYFSMNTDTTSGFNTRTPIGRMKGVLQYMKRGELLRESDVLSDVNIPTLWTRNKLKAGNFIQFCKDDEDVYRIVNPGNWKHEGNFYIYILETVTGNTYKQEAHDNVNIGTKGDYW